MIPTRTEKIIAILHELRPTKDVAERRAYVPIPRPSSIDFLTVGDLIETVQVLDAELIRLVTLMREMRAAMQKEGGGWPT